MKPSTRTALVASGAAALVFTAIGWAYSGIELLFRPTVSTAYLTIAITHTLIASLAIGVAVGLFFRRRGCWNAALLFSLSYLVLAIGGLISYFRSDLSYVSAYYFYAPLVKGLLSVSALSSLLLIRRASVWSKGNGDIEPGLAR